MTRIYCSGCGEELWGAEDAAGLCASCREDEKRDAGVDVAGYIDSDVFDDEDDCECPVEGHAVSCSRDALAVLRRSTDR